MRTIKTFQTPSGRHTFLSNFFVHEGTSVEHHYQAAKTDHPLWAAKILLAKTPGEAKRLGRRAPMRATWEQEKIAVMLVLLRKKFSRTEMAERLLSTGDAKLIEGNTWGDKFWGKVDGKGKNHLGKLLMQVREELKEARELTG